MGSNLRWIVAVRERKHTRSFASAALESKTSVEDFCLTAKKVEILQLQEKVLKKVERSEET